MAFIHGKSAVVLHGAYDLSSYLNNGSANSSVDTNEVTAFGSTSKAYVTGLKDSTLSASGMFDGSASAVDEVLTASIGSDTLSPITFARSSVISEIEPLLFLRLSNLVFMIFEKFNSKI